MRILVTGANGYIGTRLIPLLIKKHHEVIAVARHPKSIQVLEEYRSYISIIKADLLNPKSLLAIPNDIDAAYYLVHSMAKRYRDFNLLDKKAAKNFIDFINKTSCIQIIYLTGLIGKKQNLSKHLRSRFEVEQILNQAKAPLTALRAGIIIGSGSASFEIIRDLTEKLPIMVAPKWIKSKCQPLAIRDALYYLVAVLKQKECLGQTFDIGGPDILSYKEMLKGYAKKRKLFRWIISIPILKPTLSSYWLILVTSTNYYLARTLIESVKNDAICHNHKIQHIFSHKCLSYEEALDKAFEKIEYDSVPSTWKGSWSSSGHVSLCEKHLTMPYYSCLSMEVTQTFTKNPDKVFQRILMLGGKKGWYFMNWIWRIRALIDLGLGGIGPRSKRRSRKNLRVGDVIDFWRVLFIDMDKKHLILFAEMKIPGEAWLEFAIHHKDNKYQLRQKAIFRPRGVLGRLYWYTLYPIHFILFPGMLRLILKGVK